MSLDKSPFAGHPPIDHLDEAAVHSLRKKTKQLRAQLQLLRQFEGKQHDTEHLRGAVKELARTLAQQRDTDVMANLLQELQQACTDQEIHALLRQFSDALHRPHLPDEDLTKIASLVRDIEQHSVKLARLRYPDTDINQVLENRLKILCAAGQALLDSRDWEALHDWRKQVKKLMYQFDLKPSPTRRDQHIAEQLDILGSVLGRINDFTMLEHYIRQQEKAYTRVHAVLIFNRIYDLVNRLRDQQLVLAARQFETIRQLQ